MDITGAENIKKQWQEYSEELYKKDHNDPDNHDGVLTHQEPDNVECEVKWALGSIATNKARGGDRIPAELFQILIDDAVKVVHSVQFSYSVVSESLQPHEPQHARLPVHHQLLEYSNSCPLNQ